MSFRFDTILDAHTRPVLAVVLLPDGRALRTACSEVVRTWDLATGRLSAELRLAAPRSAPIQALAFSPDGEKVLACRGRPEERTHAVEVIEVASGARTLGVRRGESATAIGATALHADGHRAALHAAGHLELLDLATGARHTLPAGTPGFSPEGGRLVTLQRGQPNAALVRFRASTIRVYALEAEAGTPPREATVDLEGAAMALHPDGARALLIGERLPSEAAPDAAGTAFVVHRLDTGEAVRTADVDIDPVHACAFGPSEDGGDRVVLGYGDGKVVLGGWAPA